MQIVELQIVVIIKKTENSHTENIVFVDLKIQETYKNFIRK